MRIHIRQAGTSQCFDGNGWDDNQAKAVLFEKVGDAEAYCRERKLGKALIVLKFKQEEVTYRIEEFSVGVTPNATR